MSDGYKLTLKLLTRNEISLYSIQLAICINLSEMIDGNVQRMVDDINHHINPESFFNKASRIWVLGGGLGVVGCRIYIAILYLNLQYLFSIWLP